MRPPARRRQRLAAVVLGAGLLAGACSDGGGDDGSDATDPAAAATGDRVAVAEAEVGPFADVDVRDVAGPGTPLGGGLEVPEGALLQGAAFPDLVGGGFRALLLVTGDPVQVYDAVAAQATRLGMHGEGGCLGNETSVGCRASFVDPADGESLDLSVTRKVDALGVVSGAGLLYRPPGTVDGAAEPAGTNPPTTPLAAVGLPDPVPAPLADDLALAIRDWTSPAPAAAIEPGSTLVGLPGPCACEESGWSIVVRLDGVERDVLHAYARQFSVLGDIPDLEDRHRDDVTLVGVRIGEDDVTAEVRAFLPDDGRAYAILTVRGG